VLAWHLPLAGQAAAQPWRDNARDRMPHASTRVPPTAIELSFPPRRALACAECATRYESHVVGWLAACPSSVVRSSWLGVPSIPLRCLATLIGHSFCPERGLSQL